MVEPDKPQQPMQAEREVPPLYDFYRYFGTVVKDVFSYFRGQVKWNQKLGSILCKLPLPPSFDRANEIIEPYIPVWTTQKTYSEGRICFHVYKLIYSLLRDPEYNQLPKYERNILLWTALLHDISKRGTPVVEAKDPIHPFKSAWQTLYYFNDTFKFIQLSQDDFKEWDHIFEDAYYVKKKKERQNHAIVPKVKKFIDEKLKGKDFEREVLIYILLHQSIPTLALHPHASMLDPLETEVPKYFDQRMFKTFRIFLRHDSFSYQIYNVKNMVTFGKEIDDNVNKLAGLIKEKLE